MKLICGALTMAMSTGLVAVSTQTNAQEPTSRPAHDGPPAWVLDAWETDEAPIVPVNGPPSWVVEAWANGEMRERPVGPPPWITARHEMAKEIGLPGPPAEVLDAWSSGNGFDLPGPPSFVLDILGL